jgi:hypothetical protein
MKSYTKSGAIPKWLQRLLKKRLEEDIPQAKELKAKATYSLDEELIPWLIKINSYDGVVSMGSCTGHKKGDTYGRVGSLPESCHGHLCLGFSPRLLKIAIKNIPSLFSDGVWKVQIHYEFDKPHIQRTIWVDFHGLDASPECFEKSMNHIMWWINDVYERGRV